MSKRRLQILVDDDLHTRLQAVAKLRGLPLEAVARDAMDRGLESRDASRAAAGAAIVAARPMPVPDVSDLLGELSRLRERRPSYRSAL